MATPNPVPKGVAIAGCRGNVIKQQKVEGRRMVLAATAVESTALLPKHRDSAVRLHTASNLIATASETFPPDYRISPPSRSNLGTITSASLSIVMSGRDGSSGMSGDIVEDSHDKSDDHDDSINAVNEIIARIGMGQYQWKLFVLCGFGWLADNMWLSGISLVIPEIQRRFNISDTFSGLGTTFAFLGMMVGASIWGPLSDMIGRKPAFTMTLLICCFFGFLSSTSTSFNMFCGYLFGMGIGVGGNLPVDGALFLEFVPSTHQHFLTLLSLFWPLGQLVSSSLAWPILSYFPSIGWRYFLATLSTLTLLMMILRVVFFNMLESPKFLVVSGRPDEALGVLRELFRVNRGEDRGTGLLQEDDVFERSVVDRISNIDPRRQGWLSHEPLGNGAVGHYTLRSCLSSIPHSIASSWIGIKESLHVFWDRLYTLFQKDLIRSTLLIWAIWSLISTGYTMFNGFLPKFLGSLPNSSEPPPTEYETFRNVFIVSFMGIPGSFLGMYMIETSMGRRGTMALSAMGTALSLYLFTFSTTQLGQLLASSVASVLQNAMYGVLYCYTPEVFDSKIRGTATGVASSLSRVFGMTAPMLTGFLLEHLSLRAPLYLSSFLIFLSAVCMVLLPVETRGRPSL